LHLRKVGSLVLQPLQDKVNGLKEKVDRRKNLALFGVGENALLNAIF
jgi:hypothetical protein